MPESDGATLGQMSATIVECHQRGSPKAVICCAQPIPLIKKAAAGLTAGGLGAMVGSPADLSLIRMQSDSTLPAAQRRNYKGVGDALVRCDGSSTVPAACRAISSHQRQHRWRAARDL